MLEGLIGFFIIVMSVFIVGLLLWYVVVGVGGILGLIYNTEVTRILFCLGLLALSGWLMYAGWIGGTIHWAWSAFAGIPCLIGALVLWSVIINNE